MRLCFGLALLVPLGAQGPPATPATQAETTIRDQPATFQARVNLVMVPVVVRDRQGRAIAGLKQDDFQLFDRGKPQLVTRFSVQGLSAPRKPANRDAPPAEMPERFIAYLFDDLHLQFADLARVRDAAWNQLRESLRPGDRAAIFSASGQTGIEFTGDVDKLRETLFQLRPRSIESNFQECPDIPYYQADLIVNRNDPTALRAAVDDTMVCASLSADLRSTAESMARGAASRSLAVGGHETRIALGVVRDVIRRLAAAPGQRVLVLTSPGFEAPEDQQEKNELVDRAIRAQVTINCLDARGLWIDPAIDAGRPRPSAQYHRDAATFAADVLAELASGTGGKFFQNNNDLAAGFHELTDVPEFLYLLGFSPQNLKLDGGFHALKVTLRNPAGLVASARRGYYSPRHVPDAVERARDEIREALFSRDETREIPLELQSQFFKPANETARVTVIARVDLKALKYRKAEERNRNEVTVVAALFDRNGNYVAGMQKLVEMRLKDETVARPDLKVVVRNTFDVKPGAYLIRVVARDSEGQLMTAANSSVDIP